MDLSTAGGCKVWAGSRLLVLIELQPSRTPTRVQGLDWGLEGGIVQTRLVPVLSLGLARGL